MRCAANRDGDTADLRTGSGQFLSRVVSETEVFRRYSDNEEDEICALARQFSNMHITPVERLYPVFEDNQSEWWELGALSCLSPEILCKILSFLSLKEFNPLLCTAKAFNNNELVREMYLKCAVKVLYHRYFGDLKGNHKELESKRRHFSRHMDTAINRLRQVTPAGDIDLIKTTVQHEPLYIACLLRRCSNDGRLSHKVRLLHDRLHTVPRKLINLPGTNTLISVHTLQNRQFCNLTVWDATFDVSHLADRNGPLYDAMKKFPLAYKFDVFPDEKMDISDYGGIIRLFDFHRKPREKPSTFSAGRDSGQPDKAGKLTSFAVRMFGIS